MHAKSSLDIRLQLLNLIGLDLEGTNYSTSEHDGAQKEAVASTELLRIQLLLASNITQT